MTDPLETITDLLMKEHGIKQAKLTPSARLFHDLRIDGDDAGELFESLHKRFDTDFTALAEHWLEFFNQEGVSLRLFFPAVLLSSCISVTAAVLLPLSALSFGLICGAATAVSWAFLGVLFPGKPKRPVTIEGLAAIVRAGEWPADPSAVQ